MSRKIHCIVQNDVRFSDLPEHLSPLDQPFVTVRTTIERQARARSRPGGSLTAELPLGVIAVGLYRSRGEGNYPNDVRVLSNGFSFFITEAEYRRRECQPIFEELLWHGTSNETAAQGKC